MKGIKLQSNITEQSKLKSRISNRFRKRPKGCVTIKLKNGIKLRVEYAYGGMFSLRRNIKGKVTDITIMTDLDSLVELIFKEKRRLKV